jgi:O-antigen/teichoic acid export membrane protein
VDPEEEAQLVVAAPTGVFAGSEGKDFKTLAAGTAQNIVGLVVFVVGTFGANILIARTFGANGPAALAIVTIGTQFAFIAAAGTRFGMDMASVRYVAIEVGAGHPGRVRPVVTRAAIIAGSVSLVLGALTFALAGPIGRALGSENPAQTVASIRAGAVAIPFVALTYTWLGGSRGLKVMRHTLYVQWVAQPLLWIVLMLVLWQVIDKTEAVAVWAYAGSWIIAALGAWYFWGTISRGFTREEPAPGLTGTIVRYGAPRATAALLSQGLFWIDFFVASAFVASGYVTSGEIGVYSACVRAALIMVLFLTAVSYVFAPFVADLHERGETARLDTLFKTITRWTIAGTVPVLLLMLVVPAAILAMFGKGDFASGADALRILVIGQAINVSVGAAGFVLIMAGRTGWDLAVYVLSAILDLVLSLLLIPKFGINGAAAAQAITIACSNWLRLVLVRRFVGIFPWDRTYARLAVPAGACALTMVAVAALVSSAAWYVQLVLVGGLGVAVYVPVLLVVGLTDGEKVAMRTGLSKLRGRA